MVNAQISIREGNLQRPSAPLWQRFHRRFSPDAAPAPSFTRFAISVENSVCSGLGVTSGDSSSAAKACLLDKDSAGSSEYLVVGGEVSAGSS
jgi:hypothetical protein